MKRVTFRAKAPPLSTMSFGANCKRASCQEPPAKITYSNIEDTNLRNIPVPQVCGIPTYYMFSMGTNKKQGGSARA
jgi:hypothetical protein